MLLEPNEEIDMWWIVVRTGKDRIIKLSDLCIDTLPETVQQQVSECISDEFPVGWES